MGEGVGGVRSGLTTYLVVSKLPCMPAPTASAPRDTKREILDLAAALLQERGFNAFSYQHIAQALGIKSAAVHYHFRTKADLGVAIIERYRRRFARWAERLDTTDPWERLRAFFDIYRTYLLANGKICPAGSLQAVYNAIPEPVREATRGIVTDMQGWLATTLEEGRRRGAFSFKGSSEDQAMVFLATLQGGLQIARSCGRERFEAALQQLERSLEA